MEQKKLVLTGTAGYSEGETFSIPEGESAIVGRSRSCDFSLRKLKPWLEADGEERDAAEEFKTVSRRHVKIEVIKDGDDIKVGITDLSRNGTYVDEDRINTRFDITGWDVPHYLRLGELEQYRLELMNADEDSGENVKQIPDADKDEDTPDEETDRHEKEPDDDDDDEEEDDEDDEEDDEDEDEEEEEEEEEDDDDDDDKDE